MRGTFFTLGWVAQNHPDVVRRIVDAGHEIASHGMQHTRVRDQSREVFKEDASRAKKLLEDVGGQIVRGYRAASWSLDSSTPWAHDTLADVGYSYSSSIYPISHDHYGVPNAPRRPFYAGSGDLLEIPATTSPVFGRNLPAAGGGYFRLLPLFVSQWLIRRARQVNEAPSVFYFHPWELDPGQPTISGIPAKARFRHYLNLDKFEVRLAKILTQFSWGRMDDIYLEQAHRCRSVAASDEASRLAEY